MTTWTGNIQGLAGENKYSRAEGRAFQEPQKLDLYNRYVFQTAQAQGIVAHVYIPKSVTVAASDTLTLTVLGV